MSDEKDLPLSYQDIQTGIAALVASARTTAARSVNALMTATYWEIGHRIVTFEQGGTDRAKYGGALIQRLAADLSRRFGRGFGVVNLTQMRRFYLAWPLDSIVQTLSEKFTDPLQTDKLHSSIALAPIAARFPLPWSAYVRLLSVRRPAGRTFYEAEALRCGWSVRQLDRQIESQFFERTALSRNKAALLKKAERPEPGDTMTPEKAIRDPFVLEFLNLNDDYSESDLEDGLIRHLADFLLELGSDFTFVGRQRRLRLDDTWFRVDLLFFHRRLRCLVIIDLKVGSFTHADAGQMHLYLNYAREHWMCEGENPPVGLILCASKGAGVAHYALEGLPNVLAAEYQTILPDEKRLVEEVERTRQELETRWSATGRLASQDAATKDASSPSPPGRRKPKP
jgi:predicted nuclease of restriction endonuclease-like (RecB) superfamily